VSVAARCVTDATSSLTLGQQRFWLDANRAPGASEVWTIPVLTRPIAPPPGVPALAANRLLAVKEQSFDLGGCNALVLANAEGAGYFRTAYAPETVARLGREAEAQLTPVERLRLLNDQWALAKAGRLDIAEYLALLSGYATERRAQIIERVGETLGAIDGALTTEENQGPFRRWISEVFAPLVKDLEEPSGSGNDFERRDALAKALLLVGAVGHDPDTLARARAVVLAAEGGGALATGSRLSDAFMKVAASNGDTAVFDRIVADIEHGAWWHELSKRSAISRIRRSWNVHSTTCSWRPSTRTSRRGPSVRPSNTRQRVRSHGGS
jgi:hypothetical protein